MDKKLTLKLNEETIEKAKIYASERKISLSKLIETYLKNLTSDQNSSEIEISSFVKSIATGVEIPADLDYRKEYRDYQIKKHQ